MTRRFAPALIPLALALAVVSCSRPPARPALVEPAPPAPDLPVRDRLAAMGVQTKSFAPRPRSLPDGVPCSVDDGVVVLRGASGLRFSKPPQVSGLFALRLARLEAIIQSEAERVLGERVTRLEHVGAFTCRFIAGTRVASQHAFGNALDVSGFVLASGRRISVRKHFARAGAESETPQARFLRGVLNRVNAEGVFGSVLTPDHDVHHAGHLHLDGRVRPVWWRWPRPRSWWDSLRLRLPRLDG